jgi:CO/xanthine dehydrogenase FAD-binding subunit
VSYVRPTDLDQLVRARADHPGWLIVAGGTDVMVPINFGRLRPPGVIDVTRVTGLDAVERREGGIRLGAGVTFARIEKDLAGVLPGLAVAARAVASPQIRAVATIGGNLGTGSPAGDAHPFLLAADATVELRSVRGTREVPCVGFYVGPGRTDLAEDEVIAAVHVPLSGDMSQQFAKIGTRNAMVIAVASLGLVIDWSARRAGVGLGSVGPTPLRAAEAEHYLSEALWGASTAADRDSRAGVLTQGEIDEFARLVAEATRPIDDVRGTADYRRHTVKLMAQRCLGWALQERGVVRPC